MKHVITATCILSSLFLPCSLASGQEAPFEVKVWKEPPARGNGITGKEEITPEGHVTRVSEASMTVYPAAAGKNSGAAVLICPGGGYGRLAARHEGSDVAEWLAANGITGIVLKYRLPNHHHDIPLEDARQATRVTRENAAAWHVDPRRVGIMGFSAGGHLAATLLTRFDSLSRPDFGILFYPVITFDARLTHGGSVANLLGDEATGEWRAFYSNERHVTPATPPTLLFHSNDDTSVPPENSLLFYEAARASSVPASLHVFPSGGHGWGFRPSFAYHALVKAILLEWIQTR
jgi:acetyl esterase/lipase